MADATTAVMRMMSQDCTGFAVWMWCLTRRLKVDIVGFHVHCQRSCHVTASSNSLSRGKEALAAFVTDEDSSRAETCCAWLPEGRPTYPRPSRHVGCLFLWSRLNDGSRPMPKTSSGLNRTDHKILLMVIRRTSRSLSARLRSSRILTDQEPIPQSAQSLAGNNCCQRRVLAEGNAGTTEREFQRSAVASC